MGKSFLGGKVLKKKKFVRAEKKSIPGQKEQAGKEEKEPKMVLHLTGECPAKYPFAECKYPDENSKKQV